ncbi:MAG: TetR/AcrR family transcriptional regulator C-terminal domain-containing protein [Myxococcaceae bacterium]|nr:TetR/AcrR family transcriptional regulator C-terminal domain-containing protein [Myxococcaceae bacterium]
MKRTKKKPREVRQPVTRELALAKAMELADAEGLEGLSMRRLAQALGVEAMSLYHHVRNKDEILDGMVDLVFGEIAVPGEDEDWRVGVRRRCESAREVLKRHRWAIGVMESRKAPGPRTLAHHDAMLACFMRAGFSLPMTGHAYAVIDAFVFGFVHTELQLPFDTGPESQAVAKAVFEAMPEGQYTAFKAFTVGHVLQPGYAFGDEFGFGLELLFDGLERARKREQARPGQK